MKFFAIITLFGLASFTEEMKISKIRNHLNKPTTVRPFVPYTPPVPVKPPKGNPIPTPTPTPTPTPNPPNPGPINPVDRFNKEEAQGVTIVNKKFE